MSEALAIFCAVLVGIMAAVAFCSSSKREF
jgi:hypothetical protein